MPRRPSGSSSFRDETPIGRRTRSSFSKNRDPKSASAEIVDSDVDMEEAALSSSSGEHENHDEEAETLSRLAENHRRFLESAAAAQESDSGEDYRDEDDAHDDEHDDDNDNESNRLDESSILRSLQGVLRGAAAQQQQRARVTNPLGGGFHPASSISEAFGRFFPPEMMEMLGSMGSNIVELTNSLENDNPHLLLASLNELGEALLMIDAIVAERCVPVHKLSRNLVRIMNDPMLQGELELQLSACRCLSNLLEVNLDFIPVTVQCGAIEALRGKLMDISYIDLAEQAIQALEMISRKSGRELMRRDCLSSCLMYLDFFTIHAQRKCMIIAASATPYVGPDQFGSLKEILPTIERVATEYSDHACVENAWLTISRIVDRFAAKPDLLEELVQPKLLTRLTSLLPSCLGRGSRSQASSLITFKTCLVLFRSLSALASASPNLSLALVQEAHISTCIINSLKAYQAQAEGDRVTIDALMAAPRELVVEILRLISNLLPFVDISTVFDGVSKKNIGGLFNYKPTAARLKAQSAKQELYRLPDSGFQQFTSDMFTLLLNTYSSTVDYTIRRLVFVAILRIVQMSSPDEVAKLATDVKFVGLLASVIESRSLVSKYISTRDGCFDKNYLRSSILLYAALTTAKLLIAKAPDVFIKEFEKEGLLADITGLLNLLKSDSVLLEKAKVEYELSLDAGSADFDREPESHSESETNESDIDIDEDGNDDDNEDGSEEDDSEDENEDEDEEDECEVRRGADYKDSSLVADSLYMFSATENLTYLTMVSMSIESLIQEYGGLSVESSAAKNLHEFAAELATAKYDSAEQWEVLWIKFASLLGYKSSDSVSSFELVSSEVIGTLLALFKSDIAKEGTPCANTFQCVFFHREQDVLLPPIVLLSQKLQEALTRSESFEIISSGDTTSVYSRTGSGEVFNSRTASMAKQVKLELEPVSSGSGRLMLLVHAIATFKSIGSFLKNRIMARRVLPCESDDDEDHDSSVFEYDDDDEEDQEASPEARKKNIGDFYIEFSINGEVIPNETTIYGAIYRSLQKTPTEVVDPQRIWTTAPFLITYRRVQGAAIESNELEMSYTFDGSSDQLEELSDDKTVSLLEMLRILFDVNSRVEQNDANDAAFLNYKLAAKLNRQLEEPLVVVSGILPGWSVHITRQFPFLFPIDTRMFFLQSTSFGYSRLIQQWQLRSNQDENDNGSSTGPAQLGRASRHKVRISRKHLLQSAFKVLDMYGSLPSVLEIEYFDEVGTGLGPTLEFYANVSKELCKSKLKMWRSDGSDGYVVNKMGLFPSPMSAHTEKALDLFSFLGKFIARSLLDSRIVDFHFNQLFFLLAKEFDLEKTSSPPRAIQLEKLALVDPQLAKSLRKLDEYVQAYASVSPSERSRVAINGVTLEDLSLTYVLPGYPNVELVESGDSVDVTHENVDAYIEAVIDMTIGTGVRRQIVAFISGFSKVFPYSAMMIFSSQELVKLFGNGEEDWSFETLLSSVNADHGYTIESTSVQRLLEIMSEFTKDERRKFLQFMTGSPRLPIGGFKALHPGFTVVQKKNEDGFQADDFLPSVMTCANYLKLPDYSTKDVMRQRLLQAIHEGSGAFLLS